MSRPRGRGGMSIGRGRRPAGTTPNSKANKGGSGNAGKSPVGNSKSNSQNSNSQTPPVSNVLIPVVPPLYPPAGKPNPLNAHLNSLVPIFLELTQYYKSNYSIPIPKGKYQSAFQVARYSDRYNEPLSIDSHLIHKPDAKRLPAELLTKGITRTTRTKSFVEFNMTKKLQELSSKAEQEEEEEEEYEIEEIDLASDDDEHKTKLVKKVPKPVKETPEEAKPPEDDDDEEEEMDEELDAGTDYLANYFDNGEDYLDDEDDSVDDSAVY